MRRLFKAGVYSIVAFNPLGSMTAPRSQHPKLLLLPVELRRQVGEKVWLLQNSVEKHTKQQPTMGKIRQVPSVAGALSTLISRRFATKRYTRDEDDVMVKKMPSRDACGGV